MQTEDVQNVLRQLKLEFQAVRQSAEGWSFWTFEVEPGWIFRFPRNDVVAESLRREIAVLPKVATCVRFAVPCFEYVGVYGARPFVGYRRIPGRPLTPEDLNGDRTRSVAEALSSLHEVPTSVVAPSCSTEPNVEAWRQRYIVLREEALRHVLPRLESPVARAVERGFERFLAHELRTLPDVAVVHYDLGCEHILMDENSPTVSGLIDFEEITVGDPTVDFVGIFITCGENATRNIRKHYVGLDDENFEARLRFYCWMGAYHQIVYGLQEGDYGLVEDGIDGMKLRLRAAGLLS